IIKIGGLGDDQLRLQQKLSELEEETKKLRTTVKGLQATPVPKQESPHVAPPPPLPHSKGADAIERALASISTPTTQAGGLPVAAEAALAAPKPTTAT